MQRLNIKKITPMFNSIITTMEKQGDVKTKGGIIDPTKSKTTIKEVQRVIAIGPHVRGIEIGDIVAIDPTRFEVKQHVPNSLKDGVISHNPVISYQFDVIDLNEVSHLILQDRDIKYVVNEYEEIEEEVTPVVQEIKSSLIY